MSRGLRQSESRFTCLLERDLVPLGNKTLLNRQGKVEYGEQDRYRYRRPPSVRLHRLTLKHQRRHSIETTNTVMSDDEADLELLELLRQSLGMSCKPNCDEVSSDTGRY